MTTFTDTEARMAYCESELGNVLTVDMTSPTHTYGVTRDKDRSVVYAPGTAQATISSQCVPIDPSFAS